MSHHLKKWFRVILIFVPYINNRFVWWTHFLMFWFLWTLINIPFDSHCFKYVFNLDSKWRAECYFLGFFLFPAMFYVLYFAMERLTLLHISFKWLIAFYVVAFQFPCHWDLHLSFFSKNLILNLERRNRRRLRKKWSKTFVDLRVVFCYFCDIWIIYIRGHKWSRTHRMVNLTEGRLGHWYQQCVTVHHKPKAIVVITWRTP